MKKNYPNIILGILFTVIVVVGIFFLFDKKKMQQKEAEKEIASSLETIFRNESEKRVVSDLPVKWEKGRKVIDGCLRENPLLMLKLNLVFPPRFPKGKYN